MLFKRLFVSLILFIIPFSVFSQTKKENEDKKNQQKLEEQIQELQERIKELEQYKQEQDLKSLMQEADDLSRKQKEKDEINFGQRFFTGARKQSGLNPNLTLECDMYAVHGRSKDEYNTQPSELSNGSRNLFLREFELRKIVLSISG